MGNNIAKDVDCDVTMSNDVAKYKYYAIILHNGIAMNFFMYYYAQLGYCTFFSKLFQIVHKTLKATWNQ